MKPFPVSLLMVLLLSGCTFEPEPVSYFEEIAAPEPELFLSSADNAVINQPAGIRSVEEGVLVYDYQTQEVILFDEEGILITSFGREGDGPGEFRYIAGMWELDETFMFYDRNGGKHLFFGKDGAFIREHALDLESFSVTKAAMDENRFWVPSNGDNGTLIRYIDTEKNEITQFGGAVAQNPGSFDFDRAQQSIQAGNVPPYMQNQILLSSNHSGVFAFQQTEAVIQKFSHSGDHEWEIDIKIPAAEGIYDRFLEINKTMLERGMRNMYMLQYASQTEAGENGVYILLNTVEELPVSVVWVSNDGTESAVVQFEGFKEARPDLFSLSKSGEHIYLGIRMGGEIYKAKWPL